MAEASWSPRPPWSGPALTRASASMTPAAARRVSTARLPPAAAAGAGWAPAPARKGRVGKGEAAGGRLRGVDDGVGDGWGGAGAVVGMLVGAGAAAADLLRDSPLHLVALWGAAPAATRLTDAATAAVATSGDNARGPPCTATEAGPPGAGACRWGGGGGAGGFLGWRGRGCWRAAAGPEPVRPHAVPGTAGQHQEGGGGPSPPGPWQRQCRPAAPPSTPDDTRCRCHPRASAVPRVRLALAYSPAVSARGCPADLVPSPNEIPSRASPRHLEKAAELLMHARAALTQHAATVAAWPLAACRTPTVCAAVSPARAVQ